MLGGKCWTASICALLALIPWTALSLAHPSGSDPWSVPDPPDCATRISSAGLSLADVQYLAERGSGFWAYDKQASKGATHSL